MVIEARNLVLGYDGVPVIDGMDLSIRDGELVTIVGANGCGKSTLLRAMSRNLRPLAGTLLLDGRPLRGISTREVSRRVAFLSQSPSVPPGFTVRELVEQGRYPYASWTGALTRRDRDVVDEALAAAALRGMQDRTMATLSGGERQRAWIAMALAQEAPVLLFDEPTTFLDVHHQLQVMDLVRCMNRERGRTIVMVLHDLNHAARFSRRIVALREGRVYADGSPEAVLTPAMLRDVFKIEATVLRDERQGCPYYLPIGSAEA